MSKTERQPTQQALQEKEEQLRSCDSYELILDNVPALICYVDPQLRYQFVNKAYEDLYGISKDDIRGRHVTEVAGEEAYQQLRRHIEAALSGKRVSYESVLPLKGIGERYISATYVPDISAEGQVNGFFVLGNDITERKRSEESLRQSDERFAKVLRASPIAIIITHLSDGRIVDVNESFLHMLGYSREEIIGRTTIELGIWANPEVRALLAQKLTEEKSIRNHEAAYRAKSGEVRDAIGSAELIEWEGHECVLTLLYDITERKRNEEKLRDLSIAVHQSASGVVITQVDGTIEYVNRRFCQIVGYDSEEVLGKNIRQVAKLSPEDEKRVWLTILAGVAIREEFHNYRKNGEEYWVRVSISPVKDEHAAIMRFIGVAEDITEQQRVQNELTRYRLKLEEIVEERTRQVRELEWQRAASERLAAVGRIAARVAHEVNNPLLAINNSFLLVKEAVDKDHPYYEFVAVIETEIDRISRIMQQMLGLYRPDEETPRELSVEDLLHEVAALLEAGCREHGVTIEVDGRNGSLQVCLRENPLRQVLYNLIQNAIEASPRGGLIQVAPSITDNVLTIEVKDRGKGIPEEARPRIFEPFFSTKKQLPRAGLGLGLSICKSLVESMNGKIEFVSEPRLATVFTVSLPLR